MPDGFREAQWAFVKRLLQILFEWADSCCSKLFRTILKIWNCAFLLWFRQLGLFWTVSRRTKKNWLIKVETLAHIHLNSMFLSNLSAQIVACNLWVWIHVLRGSVDGDTYFRVRIFLRTVLGWLLIFCVPGTDQDCAWTGGFRRISSNLDILPRIRHSVLLNS